VSPMSTQKRRPEAQISVVILIASTLLIESFRRVQETMNDVHNARPKQRGMQGQFRRLSEPARTCLLLAAPLHSAPKTAASASERQAQG
jgi:hypothetical protein